jgi:predicted acetyltransferase
MTMDHLTLVPPTPDLRESYLEAMGEMADKDVNASLSYLSMKADDVQNDFTGYVDRLVRLERGGDKGLVRTMTYWGVMKGRYMGRISLRLQLNRNLSRMGGHVGYEVRPSERGRGYATEMLRRVIGEARRFGLLRILVTCDETNVPSRHIIEKCGGEAIGSIEGEGGAPWKLRYWIPTVDRSPRVEDAVAASSAFLASAEARRQIERDPYWPKWDSPWWHMLALWEMGLGHRIPPSLLEFMAERLDAHYLHHFPLVESELPPGTDPFRQILCFCAMGTMFRLLRDEEINILHLFPWLKEWIERYHMEDGGFNCDEEAYSRPRPVSSIVSTLPMLELFFQLHMLSDMDLEAPLARGYDYLMAHRLTQSIRTGACVDDSWLLPIYPRFYDYDVLRGLAFAAEYGAMTGRSEKGDTLEEARETVQGWFPQQREIRLHTNDGTLLPDGEGPWKRGPSTSFPLLAALSGKEEALKFLAPQWKRAQWFLGLTPR